MIFEGSRYEFDPVVTITDAEGHQYPAIYPNPNADRQHFQFDWYFTRQGDRYDIIAWRTYRSAELWWVIARANPEVFYPDDLPFGLRIRVPRANAVL